MNIPRQFYGFNYLSKIVSNYQDKDITYFPKTEYNYLNGSDSIILDKTASYKLGLNADITYSFLKKMMADRSCGVEGIAIARGEDVLVNFYRPPYSETTPHITNSTCKTVTAIAVMFALLEKRLSLEDKVVSFFGEYESNAIPSLVREITIEHLLTMTSCSKTNELISVCEEDWIKAFLLTDCSREPGSNFIYITAGGDGTISLKGAAVIKGNKQNLNGDKDSDIYLPANRYISGGSLLTDGAKVGVLSESNGDTIRFTDDYVYYNWQIAPDKFFFSDDSSYYVQKNPNLSENDSYYHEAFLMKTKHGHSVSEVAKVIPNCHKTGIDAYYKCTCSRLFIDADCTNETMAPEELLLLDKDPNNHDGTVTETKKTIKEATCTEKGMQRVTKTCDGCGKDLSVSYVEIDALGHSLESINKLDGVSGTGEKCKNCSYYWFTPDSVPASCSHDEYTMCERCNAHLDQRTVTDPATGHDYELRVVDTCFIYYHCPNCHSGYAAYSIHTHEMQEFTEVSPTCVSDGHESYYQCGRCRKKYDYNKYKENGDPVEKNDEELLIPAFGHSYGPWEMIEEPAADHKGVEKRSCTRCGAFELRDMDVNVTYSMVNGNDFVWTLNNQGTLDFTAKRSYKDEDAYSEWYTGTVLVDGETLSADDFTATKGSVNISLKDSFLNTLGTGAHTITVEFEDASVESSFTVKDAGKKEEPKEETTVNTKEEIDKQIIEHEGEKDLKGSNFFMLMAKGVPASKTSIKLTWKNIPGAKEYIIYGNKCGKKNKYKRITSVRSAKLIRKKLKTGTYYKHLIVAIDENGQILATSNTIHCVTDGGKNGNNTKVILNRKKLTLKVGKKKTVKAKLKCKKPVRIHRDIAWESDNPDVATVDKNGKIKGIAKGTCYVYAYAQNGVYARIKVTVKTQ